MEKEAWVEHAQFVVSYINLDNDHVITIIKTGFKDTYFVVHDDPYNERFGNIDTMNKAKLEEIYGIRLQI